MELPNVEQLDHNDDDGDGPETIETLLMTTHSSGNEGTIDDSSNSQSTRLMDSSDSSTPNNTSVISHLNTSASNTDQGVKNNNNRSVDLIIPIQLGQEYDILDSSKRWCEGQVG